MKTNILVYIDWDRGVWAMEYRNNDGEMIIEPTRFPASMSSLVVCDLLQETWPNSRLFAKAS